MANALSGFRQKVSRVAELANAVKRLHDTGIIDLANLSVTLQTVKNSRVYGPQATMAIQGGRKYPSLPAVVDERGTLTYRQVDDMSTALARGLKRLGVDEGSVVGLLCRDHRGLIIAMASCGKLGARLVLMNTGFAKPQFAQVCERECVKVVLHDSEFSGLLDALPADLPRVLTWVDDGTDVPAGAPTIDDIIAATRLTAAPPGKPGRSVTSPAARPGYRRGAPRTGVAVATARSRPSSVSPQGVWSSSRRSASAPAWASASSVGLWAIRWSSPGGSSQSAPSS
jgi:fatty-acyl-CoA synthase